jgi:hypothetical protein
MLASTFLGLVRYSYADKRDPTLTDATGLLTPLTQRALN